MGPSCVSLSAALWEEEQSSSVGCSAAYCVPCLLWHCCRSTLTPPRGSSYTSGPRIHTATLCALTVSVPAACCSGSGKEQGIGEVFWETRPTPRSRSTWRSLASSPQFTNSRVTVTSLAVSGDFQASCRATWKVGWSMPMPEAATSHGRSSLFSQQSFTDCGSCPLILFHSLSLPPFLPLSLSLPPP